MLMYFDEHQHFHDFLFSTNWMCFLLNVSFFLWTRQEAPSFKLSMSLFYLFYRLNWNQEVNEFDWANSSEYKDDEHYVIGSKLNISRSAVDICIGGLVTNAGYSHKSNRTMRKGPGSLATWLSFLLLKLLSFLWRRQIATVSSHHLWSASVWTRRTFHVSLWLGASYFQTKAHKTWNKWAAFERPRKLFCSNCKGVAAVSIGLYSHFCRKQCENFSPAQYLVQYCRQRQTFQRGCTTQGRHQYLHVKMIAPKICTISLLNAIFDSEN